MGKIHNAPCNVPGYMSYQLFLSLTPRFPTPIGRYPRSSATLTVRCLRTQYNNLIPQTVRPSMQRHPPTRSRTDAISCSFVPAKRSIDSVDLLSNTNLALFWIGRRRIRRVVKELHKVVTLHFFCSGRLRMGVLVIRLPG